MLSTENWAIILCSQKDFETTSWNEQGEITKIEGMFTITFLFVSSCSHIDGKRLKCIIRIHYELNMPYNSDFPFKKREGFDHSQQGIKKNKELDNFIDKLCNLLSLEEPFRGDCIHPPPSFFYTPDKVLKEVGGIITDRDNLRKEIEEIIKQHHIEINNLRKEFDEKISELKNELFELKEILGKNSEWIDKGGYYKRWINDDEQTWTPPMKDFSHAKVELKKVTKTTVFYSYNDKKYRTENPDYNPNKDNLEMPRSLYDQLCEESSKLSIHDADDLQSMKKYIHFIDKNAKIEKKYFNRVANFLLHHRDSKFKFEELNRSIKFKSKQSGYNLLHEFEKWGFIKQEEQAYYIVIF